jgi:hypothetical protein
MHTDGGTCLPDDTSRKGRPDGRFGAVCDAKFALRGGQWPNVNPWDELVD